MKAYSTAGLPDYSMAQLRSADCEIVFSLSSDHMNMLYAVIPKWRPHLYSIVYIQDQLAESG